MSKGFHLWHSQPQDRVTPPWLANPRPPAMSPHANRTRHLSHWFNSGGIKGGTDGGKKNDPKAKRREWPPRKHFTEHMEVMQARLTALEPNDWPRPRSLLLTVLNKYLFNLIYFSNNLLFCEEAWCCERIYHKSRPAQIRNVGPVKNRDRTLKELFHT